MSYIVEVKPHQLFDDAPYAIGSIDLPKMYYPPAGVQVWNGETGHGVKCDKHIADGVLTLYFDPVMDGIHVTVVVI